MAFLLNLTDPSYCGYIGAANETQYLVLGILHTVSASISFFSSLLVIILIILFKKYTFFVQRLILYLSIVVLLYSLSAALARTGYKDYNDFPPCFCEIIAFCAQYTQWSLLLSILVITLDILLRVTLNRPTNRLELFYVSFIALFPATINWVPFLYGLYGPAGSWCWIRYETLNASNECVKDHTGIILQFALWYGPLFVVLVLILLSYLIILCLLRRYKSRLSTYNYHDMELLRRMRKEVFILMWYPLVFMIINLFPLSNRIIHSFVKHRVYALWVLHALISPLQGGFIAIVYALDPETRRKLTLSGIKGAILQHCPCLSSRGKVQEYKAEIVREKGDTSPLLK